MNRRAFLLSSLALVTAPANAQPARVHKVAILTTAGSRGETPFYLALEARFRELGYVEGKNFSLSWHSAKDRRDRVAEVAAELARGRPDVAIAAGSEATLAAVRRALGPTPIVMVAIDYDPIEKNFISSLSKPGGNITGLFLRQAESAAKRLELLAEALPEAHRVAALWDKFTQDQLKAVEGAAKKLKITLLPFELTGEIYRFEAPLKSAKAEKAQAVLVLSSGLFFPARQSLFAAANEQRLPVIANTNYAEAGALIAFGASFVHAYRSAADYVDRILKGAKPAEMPIEQPNRYELIVNVKVAKTLGIKIPPAVLVRADRVIE